MNSPHSRPPAVGKPPQTPSGGSQAHEIKPLRASPEAPLPVEPRPAPQPTTDDDGVFSPS